MAVNDALKRIHFHGCDVEMANLTVEQPVMKVLKVEINHGLWVDRASNSTAQSDYQISQTTTMGAPTTYYVKGAHEDRDWLAALDTEKWRPFCVAVTCLIESPMKLFVQN